MSEERNARGEGRERDTQSTRERERERIIRKQRALSTRILVRVQMCVYTFETIQLACRRVAFYTSYFSLESLKPYANTRGPIWAGGHDYNPGIGSASEKERTR